MNWPIHHEHDFSLSHLRKIFIWWLFRNEDNSCHDPTLLQMSSNYDFCYCFNVKEL